MRGRGGFGFRGYVGLVESLVSVHLGHVEVGGVRRFCLSNLRVLETGVRLVEVVKLAYWRFRRGFK